MTLTDALRAEHRKALALPRSAGTAGARDVAAVAQQLVQQGFPQTTADAIALPRQESQFMGSFGPSVPATPTPMDIPRGGLLLPRRSQYPVGYNLPSPPGSYKLVDFGTLRSLAKIYDIGRRCIELRKGEVSNMDWEVSFRDPDRAKAQKTQARARARAAANGRTIATQELSEDDVAIQELTAFWDDPDPIRQLGFDGWTALLVENVLVIDAPAIFAHPTWMPGRGRLGSDLYALEVMAGDTIKPLIDVRGAPPMPPNPAYQQFIWGIPRTELQQDLIDAATRPLQAAPDGLAGEYQMPSRQPLGVVGGQSGAPQLYYPVYYPQDDSLYGFSNTEQIILTVNLALKRQQWWTAYFTDGSVPAGLLHLPEDWNPSDIREYEETWNSLLSGEMAWKHRVRAIPGSTGFSQLKPAIGTDAAVTAFDEWLARLTCIGYDVTPDELGLVPRSGIGGGGYSAAQENVTYRKSLKPLTNWLEKIARRVNARHFNRPDLVLRFMYEEAEDALKHAQEDEILIRAGVKTQVECRQDRGLDPYEDNIGTKPLIIVRSGAVLLQDVDDMSDSLARPGAQGALPVPAPRLTKPPRSEADIGESPPSASDGSASGAAPGRGRPGTAGRSPAPGRGSQRTKAAAGLELWQVQALRRLKAGRQALDPPHGAQIPSETALALRERLQAAATPDEVRAAFADFLTDAA